MGKGTIKTKAMTMAVAMSMVAGLCPSTVFAANSEVCSEGSGWNIYRDCSMLLTIRMKINDLDEYDLSVSM